MRQIKVGQLELRSNLSPLTLFYLVGIVFNLGCSTFSKDESLKAYEIEIDFKCPCNLKRDTALEQMRPEILKNKILIFSCVDKKTNDKYIFQKLINKSNIYSDQQVIDAIDSTLRTTNTPYLEREINGKRGLLISYILAREIQIYGDKSIYYLQLIGDESLDEKMEKCIESMKFTKSF